MKESNSGKVKRLGLKQGDITIFCSICGTELVAIMDGIRRDVYVRLDGPEGRPVCHSCSTDFRKDRLYNVQGEKLK